MNIHFDAVVTITAIGLSALLFCLWFVFKTVLESRRIERFCLSLGASIQTLKRRGSLDSSVALSECEEVSLDNIRYAFNSYIKNNVKYKTRLLSSINELCGTKYSLYDMHECFDNRKINGFFRDVVYKSGFLFINLVYMSCLETNGFDTGESKEVADFL